MFGNQYLLQSHARRFAELYLGCDGDRLYFLFCGNAMESIVYDTVMNATGEVICRAMITSVMPRNVRVISFFVFKCVNEKRKKYTIRFSFSKVK